MKIVYVQHFLNSEGKKYFHEKWYPTVQSAVSKQTGFISIDTTDDKNNEECLHITLKFDTDENLQKWVATKIHGDVIDLLDPYRTRDWLWCGVEIKESDPEPDKNSIEWQTAIPNNVHYNRDADADTSSKAEEKEADNDSENSSIRLGM